MSGKNLNEIKTDIQQFNDAVNKFRIKAMKSNSIKKIKYGKRKFDIPPDAKKILFWRLKGTSKNAIIFETYFARFLMKRGINVVFALCDRTLSGCINMTVFDDKNNINSIENWKNKCISCYGMGKTLLKSAGIYFYNTSQWLSIEKMIELRKFINDIPLTDIEGYVLDGVPIGDITSKCVLRYFRSAETGRNITKDTCNPYAEKILREYFYSSLVSHHVSEKALDAIRPDYVISFRGMYALWEPMVYSSVYRDIPNICWINGYAGDRKQSRMAYFKTYTKNECFDQFQAPSREHWNVVKKKPLTNKQRLSLDRYVSNRIDDLKTSSHIYEGKKYHYGSRFPSVGKIKQELKIVSDNPIWMINSHCNWDWDSFSEERSIFKDPIEWLHHTFKIIRDIKDITWVYRPHPAETKYNTFRMCEDMLKDWFGSYPDNIKVLRKESKINTYALFPLINGCITLHSTVGLELSLFGKPSIICSRGFYGERGFTYDPKTKQEYSDILNNLRSIGSLDQEQIKLVERFMYDFWLYRQIPFRDKRRSSKTKELYRNMYNQMMSGEQIGMHPPMSFSVDKERLNWRQKLIKGWM